MRNTYVDLLSLPARGRTDDSCNCRVGGFRRVGIPPVISPVRPEVFSLVHFRVAARASVRWTLLAEMLNSLPSTEAGLH